MKHLLNIFCGLMLLFPFAANCQTNLKGIDPRDIKVEISKYGDTTRYYYDENDNKILHGWQCKHLEGSYWECYSYKHGIFDRNTYYYYGYNDIEIKGRFTNGKLDSIWYDYNFFGDDDDTWEAWDNGDLYAYRSCSGYMYGYRKKFYFFNFRKVDDETAEVYKGDVDGLSIDNFTITNVFLRQNGEFDELDEELKKLMDSALKNDLDFSVFNGTQFRIGTMRIYNEDDYLPMISKSFSIDKNIEENSFNLNYKNGTRLTPEYYLFNILTRIKFTPVEEIIRICDTIEISSDDSVINNFFNYLKNGGGIYFTEKLEYKTFDLDYSESNEGFPREFDIAKLYYINPDEIGILENYFKEKKKRDEERKRQKELKRKKEEVENCLSKIYFFEGNGLNSITDDNVKSSYQNIRSEYVKERYDTITEQDIELLKKFVVFGNKIEDLSKNEMATFNQNNVEIRKVASLLCADALSIYEKEISIESKPFDDINGLNSIIDEYKNKIKMQEDFLKFAKKRQLINETENSLIEAISGNSVLLKGAMRIATGLATGQDVADIATTVDDLSKEKKSGNKHLKKVYDEYKKSFDFSWSNNGDWAERLNTFADNQNKYLRCVSLLAEIESNDAKILEATKKLKRIKKAYSEYKETLNFETIPHSDDNKTLEEFVKFQTKVFQNINSKGEFVNDSLKKIKDLNEKKAILTK
ncbi:MAG: hypothetical protein U0K83_00200 [Bacteroidales bacterium]|nr:hypothetical protein [Bacteroidales bacterium]MEE1252946.1 hypothetical protein [Bacteroidales bacterium]